jgi:hypothetical protein
MDHRQNTHKATTNIKPNQTKPNKTSTLISHTTTITSKYNEVVQINDHQKLYFCKVSQGNPKSLITMGFFLAQVIVLLG